MSNYEMICPECTAYLRYEVDPARGIDEYHQALIWLESTHSCGENDGDGIEDEGEFERRKRCTG